MFIVWLLIGAVVGGIVVYFLRPKDLAPAPQPKREPRKGNFIVKTKATDAKDFGFELDLSGITDAKDNPITDEAALASLVDEISTSDSTVVSLSLTGMGKGVAHPTGKAGQATITGRVFGSQAAKERGDDPIFIANEVWDVFAGDPAHVSTGGFVFTPVAPPLPTT
jgi:hypothetical protein